MGLFSKKTCSVCGGDIGLFGNRKLEDGNLCKNCAAKLSPWFSERRQSTVDQIRQQLQYREENKAAVASFHTTRSLGTDPKVLIDEDARKFMVTSAKNLTEANPDVLDFSQVTGVDFDIEENCDEEMREDSEGNTVSYNPPRYRYSYDFSINIRINHPYFTEIEFQLNAASMETTPQAVMASRKPDPRTNMEYQGYVRMGNEIKTILTKGRQQARDEAQQANKPKAAITCPHCGATTIPTVNGACEYCGGAI